MDLPPPIVHEIVIDHQHVAAKHLAEMSPQDLDSDWKLDEFFGCVYVINLPQAQDRLRKIAENLRQIGLTNFQLFKAIDGRKTLKPNIWKKFQRNWHHYDLNTQRGRDNFDNQRKGEAGCFMSHFKVIQTVKQLFDEALQQLKDAEAQGNTKRAEQAAQRVRKYSSVVILEDDNGFGFVNKNHQVTLKGSGMLLREAMSELPPDWEILYFGCRPRRPQESFSSHLINMTQSIGTNAYAVNHTMYEALYNFLKRIEDNTTKQLNPLDNEFTKIFVGHRVFAVVPKLSYQMSGQSYITTDPKRHPIQ